MLAHCIYACPYKELRVTCCTSKVISALMAWIVAMIYLHCKRWANYIRLQGCAFPRCYVAVVVSYGDVTMAGTNHDAKTCSKCQRIFHWLSISLDGSPSGFCPYYLITLLVCWHPKQGTQVVLRHKNIYCHLQKLLFVSDMKCFNLKLYGLQNWLYHEHVYETLERFPLFRDTLDFTCCIKCKCTCPIFFYLHMTKVSFSQ